jgi:phenylalanyl-tRNA synthetase alpha chain
VSGKQSRQRAWFAGVRSAADPSSFGKALNEFKVAVEEAVAARLAALEGPRGPAASSAEPPFDPTMPGTAPRRGSLHPITLVTQELVRVFAGLGFEVATGPEVEDEEHNFEGLNIPADHPARDPSENFTLPGGLLLRSQTSPVQVRMLESRRPPLRVLAPGRVYRPDTVDARHLYAFHQVEGLCVGEGISMADLKGTLAAFAEGFYGAGVKTRFRPSYFPFTEPSAEMDVSCPACGGSAEDVPGHRCSTCGGEGWMELLGCGMVHPRVLLRAGHDPERWTGFAFGMGIERAAMRRWAIEDIRALVENDARFLEQFP